MNKFDALRKKYPIFYYKDFSVIYSNDEVKIKYFFEIENLSIFEPEWIFKLNPAVMPDKELVEHLAFSLGMVELISYWKAACPPIVKVIPFGLDDDMKRWWKVLYFGGLGEFFYKNSITTDIDSFMSINANTPVKANVKSSSAPRGTLIPVGGGKDSSVTMQILKDMTDNLCYIINPRGATLETANAAGFKDDSIVTAKRTIDKKLIELNAKGFLNGHTPFSAIVAFSSLIAAHLNGKKYIALSNESSANESTVPDSDINHQYSKGIYFEKAFRSYVSRYLCDTAEYFSLLRPLCELQIAALFSKYEAFHPYFKSCNAGSKENIWCGKCPKCLFVYIILSPFISEEKLIGIFGKNLLDAPELEEYFKELTGMSAVKPFECVGSRDEVIYALKATLDKYDGRRLPYLLKLFDEAQMNSEFDFYEFYDNDNCLPKEYEEKLTAALIAAGLKG